MRIIRQMPDATRRAQRIPSRGIARAVDLAARLAASRFALAISPTNALRRIILEKEGKPYAQDAQLSRGVGGGAPLACPTG